MTTPNFKTKDTELQQVLDNANSLKIGSQLNYVGIICTVIDFTKTTILTDTGEKFKAIEFDSYIRNGFLSIIK